MAIIRDNELGGIYMLPLLLDWNVRRCNIVGCREKPKTIVTGGDAQGAPMFGLCEPHWEELSAAPGDKRIELEWDNFDAFAEDS